MLSFHDTTTDKDLATYLPAADYDPFTRIGAVIALTAKDGSVATWRVTGPVSDGRIPLIPNGRPATSAADKNPSPPAVPVPIASGRKAGPRKGAAAPTPAGTPQRGLFDS